MGGTEPRSHKIKALQIFPENLSQKNANKFFTDPKYIYWIRSRLHFYLHCISMHAKYKIHQFTSCCCWKG
uniref:Uncharacterized protein n=1 Tax=Anguilla anguilla TaxID=7936 RepID=A0A0E9PK46_ANGAN